MTGTEWTLSETVELPDGVVRWRALGDGPPVVLVHGTPYSSFVWRDVAPALSRAGRRVIVFDHLGYGASEKREGQDLTIAAQARNFRELLSRWNVERPSVVACDIGGAIALRTLLIEQVEYADLTLFDAVTGGEWERGLFALFREHHDVFEQLPGYAHLAVVSAHLRKATHQGFRPGVLETYLKPWLGSEGQAAFYRQYRQLSPADTADFEHLLGTIDIPVTLLWGREDEIVPPVYGEWIEQRVRHRGMTWVDGAGHLLMEDAPAQLIAALLPSATG